MNIRTLAGAAALTIAFSTAAFAATMAHPMAHKIAIAARCVSLEQQFSAAVPHHMKAHWLKTAEKLDARGTKLCAEGRPIGGELALRKALHDIGVAAKA